MENKIFGYARVSSKEQNLARQIEELGKFGIDVSEDSRELFTDKKSGKDFDRKGYQRMLDQLRRGDLVVIYSIDRLGRDYNEIRNQWNLITKEIGADIKVLDMPLLDTRAEGKDLDNTFIADLVLQILSYVAQKERENTKKRQRQGIDCMPTDEKGLRYSKKTGKKMGRPSAEYPNEWERYYNDWKSGKITATKSMQELGLTRNTFYNLAKRYEQSL